MKNNNIFENAKFGDKFITKDGIITILLRTFESNGIWHYVSNGITEYSVDNNGKVNKIYFPNGVDIVSRYYEPIDEVKLDKLAYEYAEAEFGIGCSKDDIDVICTMGRFKADYRKAMEG